MPYVSRCFRLWRGGRNSGHGRVVETGAGRHVILGGAFSLQYLFRTKGTEQLLQPEIQKQLCGQWSSDLRPRPPHPLLQSWQEVLFSVVQPTALLLQNRFHAGGGCPLDFPRGAALKDVIRNLEEGGVGGLMSVWWDEQNISAL